MSTIFIFFVVNIHTIENPVYKATCINGFGHGYGRSIEAASNDCRRQVANMVDICNTINLSLDIISKETWIAQTDPILHGLSSWDNNTVSWIEFDYQDLMKKEEAYGASDKTLAG